MSSPQLPLEIIEKIFAEIGEDQNTRLKAATLGRRWLRWQRLTCFLKLLFHSKRDVTAFLEIISSPACTFPIPIACNDLSFYGLTSRSAGLMGAVAEHITSPQYLTIGTSTGKIPRSVAKRMVLWSPTVRKLTISGGTHNPRTLFLVFASFTHLEELQFENLVFKPINSRWWWRQRRTYAFPALKSLSIVGNASSFQFFMEKVIPNGGLSNIDTLIIQTRFLLEDAGIPEMLEALCSLETVSTLILRPTYDAARHLNLKHQMERILGGGMSTRPTLLKFLGFKFLEVDFSDIPVEWALNSLATCLTTVPHKSHAFNIGIRMPRALKWWDGEDPAVLLVQLLDEPDHPITSARELPKSTLVVRDFPAELPERFREAPTMLGFPITLVDAGL